MNVSTETKIYEKTEIIDAGLWITGKVVTKKCEHCGHHEVGIVTPCGNYIQLKEGMELILKNPKKEEG